MEIRFLGAAREVTGSCFLVRCRERQLLIDCGLIQDTAADEARKIDAVILTHAHLDHSDRLPLLVKAGFRGPIYTHRATRDLCQIMLKDAASLNEKDAEHENRRRQRQGKRPVEPLYTRTDAEKAMRQFQTLDYDKERELLPGVRLRLQDAGHILGSAIVELWLTEDGHRRRKKDGDPFTMPNLQFSRTPAQSMAINRVRGGAIIIAGSGMCDGGRIRHHFKHNLWREQCHVIIAGFQARGTLGRKIVDGVRTVKLWSETIHVGARIHTIGGLSAHAGQSGLLEWYWNFERHPTVALVHGETEPMQALTQRLEAQRAAVLMPQPGERLNLLSTRPENR